MIKYYSGFFNEDVEVIVQKIREYLLPANQTEFFSHM